MHELYIHQYTSLLWSVSTGGSLFLYFCPVFSSHSSYNQISPFQSQFELVQLSRSRVNHSNRYFKITKSNISKNAAEISLAINKVIEVCYNGTGLHQHNYHIMELLLASRGQYKSWGALVSRILFENGFRIQNITRCIFTPMSWKWYFKSMIRLFCENHTSKEMWCAHRGDEVIVGSPLAQKYSKRLASFVQILEPWAIKMYRNHHHEIPKKPLTFKCFLRNPKFNYGFVTFVSEFSEPYKYLRFRSFHYV